MFRFETYLLKKVRVGRPAVAAPVRQTESRTVWPTVMHVAAAKQATKRSRPLKFVTQCISI
jgi:hypothetical protein